jgi:hypothetical protein
MASIFQKHSPVSHTDQSAEHTDAKPVLLLEHINRSIPPTATTKPDPRVAMTHTEWRWRFFEIGERKLVEISKKEPNQPRQYIDASQQWVEQTVDEQLDKWVVRVLYCYADEPRNPRTLVRG